MTSETIQDRSHVTLHYRLADDGDEEIVSTFAMGPATIQMGAGQLSANLEKCLLGLQAGDARHFVLMPDAAFGERHPMLVRTLPRSSLPPDVTVALNEPVRLLSETGVPYAGIVRGLDETRVIVDFNHPLAGKTMMFDVRVVGVINVDPDDVDDDGKPHRLDV